MLKRQLHHESGTYSPELRTFVLTLNFYSPAAYSYVREKFNNFLPHSSTLQSWYSCIDGKPGFTTEALNAISVIVLEMKNKGKKLISGLMMDEMHIKENVTYKGNRLIGYINYGTGTDNCDGLPKATQVLVFMLIHNENTSWLFFN